MTESVAEGERQRRQVERTRSSLDLWFGMVGGPMAGMLMVWINYPLVDRACVSGNRLWLHGTTLLFLLIAIAAGLSSWRFYQRLGDFPLTEGGVMPRSRFMALVGMFTASLAIIEIAMQWIPVFLLGSCIGT
ncbi:MAG TPA: hypothetical protein VHL32_10540 [Gemmatimonadaceae bacterium]|jgi:hypothetical protein|nr:hypothetical protein [Gemmatimonadaceae bacterium]